MMRQRHLHLVALALMLAFGVALPGVAGAEVRARVDRTQAAVGEPLSLSLEARGNALQAEPGLDVLAPDFRILGVTRGHRTSVINGVRDEAAEWNVVVAPMRAGRLEIPAIGFGPEASAPLAIDVVAGAGRAPSAGRPGPPRAQRAPAPAAEIGFESRVDATEPFVQEQVVLTVRLESTVPLLEGQVHAPEIPGAIVEHLGEDHQETKRVGDRAVQVFERRYAIFPQRSGELQVPPFVFEGTSPAAAARSRAPGPTSGLRGPSGLRALMGGSLFDDPFFEDFFARTGGLFDDVLAPRSQPVQAATEPLVLAVKPRPDAAPGERWLPARGVEIVERWGDGTAETPVLRVGEPVDRLVAVQAHGVSATQLPEGPRAEVDGLKEYTQPASLDNQERAGMLVGTRAVASVVIPTRPGAITLPALEIPWWDVEAGVSRVATLPARTFEVLPGAGDADVASLPPAAGESGHPADAPHAAGPPGDGIDPSPAPGLGVEPGIALLALLAAGVLVGGALHLRTRREPGPEAAAPGRHQRPERSERRRAERALARACRRRDASAAVSALTALARCRWPGEAVSAADLAGRLGDDALEHQVRLLLSGLYRAGEAGGERGAAEPTFSGDELWRAYRGARRRHPRGARAHEDPLPELYPSRG